MKKILTSLFCFLSLLSVAQQERQSIDSLLRLAKTASPNKKIYLYDGIALKFYRNQTDSAIKYSRMTLRWAIQTNDSTNIPYAHTFLGVLYKNKGFFDSSLHHYFKALRFQQANGFDKGMAGNYNNIATVYKLKGRYDQAIVYYHKALPIFTAAKDYTNLNIVVQNLAELYLDMGEEEKARGELRRAEQVYKESPNDASRAYLYQGMGEIYQREKKFDKARENFVKAINLQQKLKRGTDLVKTQIALGKLFMAEENIVSCDSLIRIIEGNFANVPSGYDSAEVRLLEARLALVQKKYPQVITKAQVCITTAQRVEAQALVMQSYDLLSQAYEQLNDPKKALYFFRQYKYLEDSINGLERQKTIAELETKYSVSEKENQISRLRDSSRITSLENARTSLELSNQQTRNSLLWALAGVILIFSIVFYIRYRQKRSLSKQLQSSLSERELLIREIHHRVKNNLQIINSLLNLQLNRQGESDVKSVIQLSQDRIHTMAMIHEKLYQSANLENISIDEYISGMCQYYRVSYGLDTKNISIGCVVNSPNIHIDQLIPLGLILNELIINSIKYAFTDGGLINISCNHVDGFIIFIVEDNGKGLPPDYKDRMKKSLGIQLVQGLCKQLKATLDIENNHGAKFVIRFRPIL